MITLLDTVGPAVLRASGQATVLAFLVMLLVKILGERIAPRWRYLLGSIVVYRLLLVAIPASPWSAFNLVRLIPDVRGADLPARCRPDTRQMQHRPWTLSLGPSDSQRVLNRRAKLSR